MTCNPVTEKVSDGFKQVLEECEDLPEECSKEPPDVKAPALPASATTLATATPAATAPIGLARGGSIASAGSGPLSSVTKPAALAPPPEVKLQ